MAIATIGTNGLFTRIGRMAYLSRNLNGLRGANVPNPSSAWGSGGPTVDTFANAVELLANQYEANVGDAALASGLSSLLSSFRSSVASPITTMQALASATLIYMANADTPLASANLSNAMALLIKQMKTATTKYVLGNTVTATVTAGAGNVGNAVMTASVIGVDGVTLQYPFPETLTATVTSDGTRGSTANNEPISVTGTVANSDPLDYLWPQGSGLSGVTLNVADPTQDNTSGNLLTNSSFEVFTVANRPDQWTVLVGTLGTDIVRGATHREGTYSISFVGDGATLSSISQVFDNDVTGTAGTLDAPPVALPTSTIPTGVFALSAWMYVDVVPAAGVVKIDLIDGSGTIINDNAGTANTITRTVSTMTVTTWTNVTGYFRLPTVMPSSVSLRIRVSTAITAGSIIFIDDVCLTRAVQLYTGGPFVAAFAGTTDAITNDSYSIAIANNLGNPTASGGLFTEWFERFFGMRTLGMTLPVSGTTQIAESLCL